MSNTFLSEMFQPRRGQPDPDVAEQRLLEDYVDICDAHFDDPDIATNPYWAAIRKVAKREHMNACARLESTQ